MAWKLHVMRDESREESRMGRRGLSMLKRKEGRRAALSLTLGQAAISLFFIFSVAFFSITYFSSSPLKPFLLPALFSISHKQSQLTSTKLLLVYSSLSASRLMTWTPSARSLSYPKNKAQSRLPLPSRLLPSFPSLLVNFPSFFS